MAEQETNSLSEQHKAEREFYLGDPKDDDKVPGTDKTVKEVREELAEATKKEEEETRERAAANMRKRAEKQGDVTATQQGTIVSGGAVTDVEIPDVGIPLTEEYLNGLTGKRREKLQAIALSRNIPFEGNDTIQTLIDKILAANPQT